MKIKMRILLCALLLKLLLLFPLGTAHAASVTWTGVVSADWNNRTNWSPQQVPTAGDHVIINSGTVSIPADASFGIMDWSGGTVQGSGLTVTGNAVLNLLGSDSKTLISPLTNYGTVNWQGGNLKVSYSAYYHEYGAVWNQADGLFDIRCDEQLFNSYGAESFCNAGLVQKSATTGTNTFTIAFYNTGTVLVQSGTIQFQRGGQMSGAYEAQAGAQIQFQSGGYTLSPSPTMSGAGFVGMAGGTIGLSGSFAGRFDWREGQLSASAGLTVLSNAVLNLVGSGIKNLSSPLTNYGTVNWQGGNLKVSYSAYYHEYGAVWNQANGLFDIRCDEQLFNSYGAESFCNAGLVQKSATTGTNTFTIAFYNTGTVLVQSGTIQFQRGGQMSGAYEAQAGAQIQFQSGGYTLSPSPTMSGAGFVGMAGGTIGLSGSFAGRFDWREGQLSASAGLTVLSNAVLNLVGSGIKNLSSPLTNYGTVNWQGGDFNVNYSTYYTEYGAVWNQAGGVFDIQCDQSLHGGISAGFNNAGLVRKSAGPGTSTITIGFNNNGTLEAMQGALALNGGFTPSGGTLRFGLSSMSSFGRINISGNATLDGTVSATCLAGFVPAMSNSFPVLTYGSRTGAFTNTDLPPAASWMLNYGPTTFSLLVTNTTLPEILAQPQSANAAIAQTITLGVTASGTPPLFYQWQFNGTNLTDNGRVIGSLSNNLTLANLLLSDEGNYQVIITNAYGAVTSSLAHVTVNVCFPAPSGLISWWPAESNALDIVGINHGTLVGSVAYSNGKAGAAFSLTGINAYVEIGTNLVLGNTFTEEAWIYPKATDAGWRGFLGYHPGTPARRAPSLYVYETNKLHGGFGDGTTWNQVTTGPVLADNAWNHVAATFDGSNYSLYVNGAMVLSTSFAGHTPYPTPVRWIGRVDNQFTGLVDEVSIYSRALTSNEIAAIYNASSAGKCVPALAPAIIEQPQSQSIIGGMTASFTVTAIGTKPLSYQWYFNSTNPIGTGNLSTLVLPVAQTIDAGNYSVVVGNAYGSVTSQPATLTVRAPRLLAYDGFAYVPVGSDLAGKAGGLGFNGGWSGDASGYYDLASGSLAFPGLATDGNSVHDGASSSTSITRALASPLGTAGTTAYISFLLRPDGAFGINSWCGLTLNASTGVRPFIGKPGGGATGNYAIENAGGTGQFASPTTAVEGQMALLVVKAEFTAGLDRFTLYMNPTPGAAEPSSGTEKNDTDVGLIDSLSIDSSILCSFDELRIGETFAIVTPPRIDPPVIVTHPGDQVVALGGTASFSVGATGSLPLTYQWFVNQTNLLTGATNATLTLAAVQLAEGGNYNVMVSNSAGAITSAVAALTIIVPPTITTQPQSLTVAVGESVSFHVTASGTTPNYQWQHDGVNVTGAIQPTLLLSNVQTNDAGAYEVVVRNAAGSVTSTPPAILTVYPLAWVEAPSGLRPDGSFEVRWAGGHGTLVLEASQNLLNWVELTRAGAGAGSYVDAEARNRLQRFYRLRVLTGP